ncbi:hypothetical protein QGM71_07750 [Virgibacillus sp. C22-A2]|uniref:Transposase n=1 Tax=Virgibacillus tibetensis TaxID=3042313 RepID=A0ABU6KDN4_9BACI|nr:hypothetical protein [Virgibacillus sp. C22-A2]
MDETNFNRRFGQQLRKYRKQHLSILEEVAEKKLPFRKIPTLEAVKSWGKQAGKFGSIPFTHPTMERLQVHSSSIRRLQNRIRLTSQ